MNENLTNSTKALLFATQDGDLKKIQALIGEGADVNAEHDIGGAQISPLALASGDGNIEVARLLVQSHANVNGTTDSITPLISASEKSQIEMIKFLLVNGADVNGKGAGGLTPLTIAAATGKNDVLKLLIAKGANVNEKNPNSGKTAVSMASDHGFTEAVKLLVENGAVPPQKESSCFVATAVYGSPDAPELNILRRWRDSTLSHSHLGRRFIRIYYMTGPFAARIVSKAPLLKYPLRIFLNRLVGQISHHQP